MELMLNDRNFNYFVNLKLVYKRNLKFMSRFKVFQKV